MTNKEQPVDERHVAFARALIALAREHGADNLEVRFSLTGSKLYRAEAWSSARVTFNWSEGRHGSTSQAMLRAESTVTIKEQADG